MLQKAILKGKFIVINVYIKKNKDLKQLNFTTQGTEKGK